MKNAPKIQFVNEALTSIQRLHTAFGDMFPHAGLVQIGGSRKFIQKSYLSHLSKVIESIRSLLDLCGPFESNAKVSKVWSEIVDLLSRLELNSPSLSDTEINSIAITLYFSSGVMWHYLVDTFQITPVPDRKYLRIEPIPVLLQITNRTNNDSGIDINKIIDLLIEEIHSLAVRK